MELIVLVGGTLAFLVAARLLSALARLLRVRLQAPTGRVVAPDEIPEWLRSPPAAVSEPLRSLGFEPSHFERRRPLEADLESTEEGGRAVAVWVNRTDRVLAELQGGFQPTAEQPLRVTFESLFDERHLSTVQVSDLLVRSDVGTARFVKPDGPGYLRQWAAHCLAWQALEEEHGAALEARLPCPEDHAAQRNAEVVDVLERLRRAGDVVERDGGLYFHWRRLLHALVRPEGHVATPAGTFRVRRPSTGGVEDAHRSDDAPPAAIEAWAYRQREALEAHAVPGPRFKTLVLAASALYCTGLLSFLLPWDFLAFLLPVLLLHELGHLAAMHVFGYTDKRLFFMPLGAAVTGRNKNASSLQESLVYLAGPVPGLILALALLWLVPEPGEPLLRFAVVLLVVNGLNLLPLLPLDGGQIVYRLIGSRFPTIQLLLYALSVTAAVAFAATLQDVFLGLLAVWLILCARVQWRTWRTARALAADPHVRRATAVTTSGSEQILLERLFALLERDDGGFERRRLVAETHVSALSRRPMSIGHALGVALLLVASLLGPPLIAKTLLLERDAVADVAVRPDTESEPRLASGPEDPSDP